MPRRLRARWYVDSGGEIVGGGLMPSHVMELYDVVAEIHATWWVWRGLIYRMRTKRVEW